MKLLGHVLMILGLVCLVIIGLHAAAMCLLPLSLCPMWLRPFVGLPVPMAATEWSAAWPLLASWCCFVAGVAVIAWAEHKAKARGSEV